MAKGIFGIESNEISTIFKEIQTILHSSEEISKKNLLFEKLALLFRYLGHNQYSIDILKFLLEEKKDLLKKKKTLETTLKELACLSLINKDFSEAIKNYSEAFQVNLKLSGSKDDLLKYNKRITEIYLLDNNTELALINEKKSKDLIKSKNKNLIQFNHFNNYHANMISYKERIAMIYAEKGEYSKASEKLTKIIAILEDLKKPSNDYPALASIFLLKGLLEMKCKNKEEGSMYFEKSRNVVLAIGKNKENESALEFINRLEEELRADLEKKPAKQIESRKESSRENYKLFLM